MRLFILLFALLLTFPAVAQTPRIVVNVSDATICFDGQCHPALVGDNTKAGTYGLAVLHVAQPGYGPHVLMYDRDQTGWYAIHQTYQYGNVTSRHQLYYNSTPEQRTVTEGCVNVEPHIYDHLYEHYRNGQVVILP